MGFKVSVGGSFICLFTLNKGRGHGWSKQQRHSIDFTWLRFNSQILWARHESKHQGRDSEQNKKCLPSWGFFLHIPSFPPDPAHWTTYLATALATTHTSVSLSFLHNLLSKRKPRLRVWECLNHDKSRSLWAAEVACKYFCITQYLLSSNF